MLETTLQICHKPGAGRPDIFSVSKFASNRKPICMCHWLEGMCEQEVFTCIDDCDGTPDAKVWGAADEVDSVLSHRGRTHQDEVDMRLKTQFMAEFDGVQTSSKHIVLIAATNRPQDLDVAVRYDFTSRHSRLFLAMLGAVHRPGLASDVRVF